MNEEMERHYWFIDRLLEAAHKPWYERLFASKAASAEREQEADFSAEDFPLGEPVDVAVCYSASAAARPSLATRLANMDAGFSESLLMLIDERGMTDAEVYQRAHLSRQLFSKIRTNPKYRPTKPTALALALALELDREETAELLKRAGYSLSNSKRLDVIVGYFIDEGEYDLFVVNEALMHYDQPVLGSNV